MVNANERIERLLAAYCLDELTPAEEKELHDALAELPSADRARRLWPVLVDRLLAVSARPVDPARVMSRLPAGAPAPAGAGVSWRSPRLRRTALVATAAAAIALLVGAAAFFGGARRRAIQDVGSASGERTAARASARWPGGDGAAGGWRVAHTHAESWRRTAGVTTSPAPGVVLGAGDGLETGGGASAAFLDGAGATLAVGPSARLAIAGDPAGADAAAPVVLARGYVLAQSDRRAIAVETPHARVRMSAARALITVTAGGTRVEVQRGRVAVGPVAGGATTPIEARRAALVSGTGAVAQEAAPPSVLFLAGSASLDAQRGDDMIAARIERLGVRLMVRRDVELNLAEATASDAVFVACTVHPDDVDRALRDVPVPVLVDHPWMLQRLGMTTDELGVTLEHEWLTNDNSDNATWARTLAIVAPGHPLAAGLTGVVEVARVPVPVNFGRPNGAAVAVATISPDQRERVWASIFTYDTGAAMPGLVAPARRIAVFVGLRSAPALTEQGWSLLDAAVRWALAGRAP